MLIRYKTIIIILITNIIIVAFAISAGALFVHNSINNAQEADLRTAAINIDNYISSVIETQKLTAAEVAYVLSDNDSSELQDAINDVDALYPDFFGMSVIDLSGDIIASAGEYPAPSDIIREKHISQAFSGERRISTTIPYGSNDVVFYIAVPMPRAEDTIFVATIPGSFFSELFSDSVIWDAGYVH